LAGGNFWIFARQHTSDFDHVGTTGDKKKIQHLFASASSGTAM
jgi:hypothetical protein